ncbi:DNA-directed RNA polymerase subunit beta [Nocardia sp. NPDC003482]
MNAEVTTALPVLPADPLAAACVYYRQACQLDARVRPELAALIVTTSHTLGAITMPASLGARVRLYLRDQGRRVGPILSHSASARWTFLTRADIPCDTATSARMYRRQVAVARPGTEITVPSLSRQRGPRQWVEPPTDPYRTCAALVVAATDACAAGLSHPGPRQARHRLRED